jgi:glycerol dehydrogenase
MTALTFGSPGRYIQGDGVIDDIGEYIRACSPRALVLCDSFVREQFGSRIAASCAAHGVEANWLEFSGELTRRKAGELTEAAQSFDYRVVVAIGGGKTLDAGKAVVDMAGCALITVPTIASNDSPTSKNYVLYDDDHQLAAVNHLPRSAAYVVVDTALIAQAPTHFLLAGIGDAISKYFEAEQCLQSGGNNMFGARPSYSAYVLARECFSIIRSDAVDVLGDLKLGRTHPAFDRLVEAVLLMSGLGFESGGLSIAHSMTRGLSRLGGAAHAPHGLQVAYALLVQLQLEHREPDFMHELIKFYEHLGLPARLIDLGAGGVSRAHYEAVARFTLEAPHARNFVHSLSIADIVSAMEEVERIRV